MPVRRTCVFCGEDITPGTGKMFIRRDGTIFLFCSSKCEKNQLGLGRQGRTTRWTKRYRARARGVPLSTTEGLPQPVATPPAAAEGQAEEAGEGEEA